MAKVEVIKLFSPDKFLGIDLSRKKLIDEKCEEIRANYKLSNVTEVLINKIYLAIYDEKLIRVRAFSEINPTTFKCMFIDEGTIQILIKPNLYNMGNHSILTQSPAAKLFRLWGVRPTEMKITPDGPEIKSSIEEGKKWPPRSYKFVCKIFEENNVVVIDYKREQYDKAVVQVKINYQGRLQCLVNLLVQEKLAVRCTENLPSSIDETESNIGSLSNESLTQLLAECHSIPDESEKDVTIPKSRSQASASSFTSSKSTNVMAQSYLLDLERLVKCWYVNKSHLENRPVSYIYRKHISPIVSYQNDKHVANFIKSAMSSYGSKTLLNVQAYMIPAVLRGVNVLGIAPKQRGKSMGILIPILQIISSKNLNDRTSFDPIAIIVCSSWQKVAAMADSAKKFLKFLPEDEKKSRPKVVAGYAGSLEKKLMMNILNGCELLIITPRCLLRLLKQYDMFKLKSLEILALDDLELLINLHLEYIRGILIYKQTAAIENSVEPQRIVTATNWSSGVESFVRNEIGDSFSIVVNDPLEIAVFERLNQKLVCCEEKMDAYKQILSYLSVTEAALKRTIIFTTDDAQLLSLYRYLTQNAGYDMIMLKTEMTGQELVNIEEEWKNYRGYLKMPILLISDGVLGRNELSITQADLLFHLDISKSTFSLRLNCLHDKFKELTFLSKTNKSEFDSMVRACYSYIFLCPETMTLPNANFLYKLLGRCNVTRPEWLRDKSIDYVLKREISKGTNDICPRIKSFGQCDLPVCDRRHLIKSDVDKPLLPNKGTIKFCLLYMESPAHFHIRILEHKNDDGCETSYIPQFMDVKMKMINYFSQQHNIHGVNNRCVKPGLVAGVKIDRLTERVMVVEDNRGKFKSGAMVYVKFIDVGDTRYVEQSELLQLSQELIQIPPQAIEVFLVGVRPLDNDESYSFEAKDFAKKFIIKEDLYALIILCIGSTLWIDSVCQKVTFKVTKTTAYDKNLTLELIKRDFAESNSSHMEKLIRLCTGKVDIWRPNMHKKLCRMDENSNLGNEGDDEDISTEDIPIMKRFTYELKPICFEEISVYSEEEEYFKEVCGEDENLKCKLIKTYSPNCLVLQLKSNVNALLRLQAEIRELVQFMEIIDPKEIITGARILYKHESQWHRCLVLGRHESNHLVRLLALDWGNIYEVDSDHTHDMKKLPSEYQDLKYQAIFASLNNIDHSSVELYSDDVNTLINNFCLDSNQRALDLSTICESHRSLKKVHQLPKLPTEMIEKCKLHVVELLKPIESSHKNQLPEVALHEILIRAQAVVPSAQWIQVVLPESTRPISRMNRQGSVVHLTADILMNSTQRNLNQMANSTRIRLAQTVERIILNKIQHYQTETRINKLEIDDLINCLIILLHFVNQQSVFVCFINSLQAILDLTQHALLEFKNRDASQTQTITSKQLFTIDYVCEIFTRYHSIMHHLLKLFDIILNNANFAMNNNKDLQSIESNILQVCTFIEVLRLLLFNKTVLTPDLFLDDNWCNILACSVKCVGEAINDPILINETSIRYKLIKSYELLFDMIVHLVKSRYSDSKSDKHKVAVEFGGILQQAAFNIQKSNEQDDNVLMLHCLMALMDSLIQVKAYWDLFKKFEIFQLLLSQINRLKTKDELLGELIELLIDLWHYEAVVNKPDKETGVSLADKLRSQINHLSSSANDECQNQAISHLNNLLSKLRIVESSLPAKQDKQNPHASTNKSFVDCGSIAASTSINVPDEDAEVWLQGKDIQMVKQHNKSYQKLFQSKQHHDDYDYDNDNNSRNNSDNDQGQTSSGEEDGADEGFLALNDDSRNPANEDNLNCFDRA